MTHQRQMQRVALTAHTTKGNLFFTQELDEMTRSIMMTGTSAAEATHRALAQLSAQVDLQASLLSFKNAQSVLGVVVLLLVSLPLIMRRPSKEEAEAAH